MPRDFDDLSRRVVTATNELDRDLVNTLADQFIIGLTEERPGVAAEKPVTRVLQALRRKRIFEPMGNLAKVYLDQVPDERPEILLQLIQTLIDQGKLLEAKYELEEMAAAHPVDTFAGSEARGILGRVHKQAYVDGRQRLAAARRSLGAAVQAYLEVYRADPAMYWWQGINAVACLARAERDEVALGDLVQADGNLLDWKKLAEQILPVVAAYPGNHDDYTWAMATATEACIALEQHEKANHYCERYINAPWADVFELGSTERQLREVWELDHRDVPGAQTLNILQGRLGRLGGSIEALAQEDLQYQARLGSESGRAVRWLEILLKRASSVGKIYKATDDTVGGTGFLVNENDIDPAGSDRLVILTNYHVVNEMGDNGGIRRESAVVRLTRTYREQEFTLGQELWSDPGLDASVFALELPPPRPDTELGLPLGRTADLEHGARNPRLYVVGHAEGAPLQISLYDNHLIEIDKSSARLRYRSPTETGSSGSPVLSEDLTAVAVHHATRTAQPANQGILLDSISACIREQGGLKKED